MIIIEKSLNLSEKVKYVRVYEANRICGCRSGACKFEETSSLKSSRSLRTASFVDDTYYERSYINNLANYIKVLDLSDPKEEERSAPDSPESDYRSCLESFGEPVVQVEKCEESRDTNQIHTLDELINFLDERWRSVRVANDELNKTLKHDPRSHLDDLFKCLNRDLFDRSLQGICARWSKSSLG